MNKTYVVKEILELGDFYVIRICPTRELAEKLKQKNENLLEIVFVEVMIEKYPVYPISDIEIANREFSTYNYIETTIEEIDLYTNDTDITLYGINY